VLYQAACDQLFLLFTILAFGALSAEPVSDRYRALLMMRVIVHLLRESTFGQGAFDVFATDHRTGGFNIVGP
jgi:hypothetical protein